MVFTVIINHFIIFAKNKFKFFEKFVNNLRVWVNPKHANKSFKHISIVYE